MTVFAYVPGGLDALPGDLAVLVPTGRCPECALRVPVTRDRRTVIHYPVDSRPIVCTGSIKPAGMIMVAARM